jgi:hypothetical protein
MARKRRQESEDGVTIIEEDGLTCDTCGDPAPVIAEVTHRETGEGVDMCIACAEAVFVALRDA